MWRSALLHQLSLDILPLRRQGANFTWKTLEELHARLVRATLYACGREEDIERRLLERAEASRPSLFDAEQKLRPLPQAHMLLEFEDAEGCRKAALLTDKGTAVELYVFRFDSQRGRWRWPLIGMIYGPTFEDNGRIAVYEPSALAASSQTAQNAMVREHVLGARLALACLELVRHNLVQPEGEAGPSAAGLAARKKDGPDLPTPSALARAGRTRHEKGRIGKGAHRM